MREKQNIILTMLIAGALAGLAAALMFLTGFMEWDINQSNVSDDSCFLDKCDEHHCSTGR